MTRLLAVLAAVACAIAIAPAHAAAAKPRFKPEKHLNELHCDAGRADGRIDRHTRSAIVRFQSRVGIRQTGQLDERTRKRLRADDAPRCDRRPVPRGTGQGRRIVVSQAQNWVWLVDRRGKVVAQGGMVDNASVLRKGSWGTGSYCGRPARVRLNQSGAVWMDDFVRFAPCGIGFHRIPRYQSTGRQMHPDWYLGTNLDVSHGCVRLSAGLARTLWNWTAGTYTRVRVV
ncbi:MULTISPECIES: L,D-transpeptidase family protein [unclassified Nocardioides]|uniref:L,D-transpeptidase family protein n=1 Tax=unclassified Nocardioides TaxID=2615069 RepID=UPI00360C3FA4